MSRARASSRQHSRQVALQVLYAMDLAAPDAEDAATCAEEAFERVAGNFEMPEGARSFARELSLGTAADLERIDQLLATHARNWRVSRMAVVDRNLLRLAVYELTHTDTPASVVLDEAIELARRFGSDSSPAFVNGVLDGVAHGVRAESNA